MKEKIEVRGYKNLALLNASAKHNMTDLEMNKQKRVAYNPHKERGEKILFTNGHRNHKENNLDFF